MRSYIACSQRSALICRDMSSNRFPNAESAKCSKCVRCAQNARCYQKCLNDDRQCIQPFYTCKAKACILTSLQLPCWRPGATSLPEGSPEKEVCRSKSKSTCQSNLHLALFCTFEQRSAVMAFLLAVMGGAAAVELVKRISGREEPVQDENEVLRRQHELQRLLQVLARAGSAAESRSTSVCTI